MPTVDKPRMWSIRAKGEKEAEVWIYEDIGEYWGEGISSKQFAEDIRSLGEVDKITVHLNSPGGSPFEGSAIYNTLRSNKAEIIMNIDGLAASAASIVAMAGDTINIAENAMVMIHEAAGITFGNAVDHERMAESLRQINSAMTTTYVRRSSLDEEKVAALMAAETWMTAADAIEYGFADQLTEPLEIAAHFDLDKFKFKNAPEKISSETPPDPKVGVIDEPAGPKAAEVEEPPDPKVKSDPPPESASAYEDNPKHPKHFLSERIQQSDKNIAEGSK